MRKRLLTLTVIMLAFTAGLIIQVSADSRFAQVFASGAEAPDAPNHLPAADLLFERISGPDVPTLQEMTAGATTDAEALAKVVAYYDDNRERLRVLWREEDDTRLAGIFSMYVVHVSTIYGETTYPASFLEYLQQPRAHCGTYSIAQAHIANALGLEWRMFELTSGWHGWIEINVDGQWEMFDATTNQWISRSGLEMLQGAPREYRSFYTPLLDIDRPDARLHMSEGYNMQQFRIDLPGLGLFYNPPGEISSRSIPTTGMRRCRCKIAANQASVCR